MSASWKATTMSSSSFLFASVMTSLLLGMTRASTTIQILHSSDQESSFVDPNTQEEKVIYYSALVQGLQMLAEAEGIPSMHVTVGDHTITGPFYQAAAELEAGFPGLGDITMYNAYPNLANCLGNHEFDGGIDDIARMINAANYPFLSVNLDLSGAELQPGTPDIVVSEMDAGPCADIAGQVAKSCYLDLAPNVTVGLIGRAPNDFFNIVAEGIVPGVDFVGGRDPVDQTPLLSSVPMVLEQVDLLQNQGVNIILLLDHAQDFTDDPVIASDLRGVDIIIQAGATGFLAGETMGPFNYLRPEDEAEGPYPTVLMDSENKTMLAIDSDELYFYIGQLLVTFDDNGDVESWDVRSGPIATTPEAVDLLTAELGLNMTLQPIPAVRETLDLLLNTSSILAAYEPIGSTTVPLNGVRASVRTRETNLGRVVADSSLWAGNEYAAANGLPMIDVAVKNGGGIRDQITGPTIIRLNVEVALAFDNTLALVELNTTQFLAAMENGVSRIPDADGRFMQVAGLMLEYNDTMPGVDNQESMDTPSRVKSLMVMKNGTMVTVVEDYMLVADSNLTITVATNNFLLTGGDGYFSFAAGMVLGETTDGEQQILIDYIGGVLGGEVDVMDPPPNPRVAPAMDAMMPTDMPTMMPTEMPTMMPTGETANPTTEPITEEPTVAPSQASMQVIVGSFALGLGSLISLLIY